MNFLSPRRANPFDNVVLALLLHAAATGGMFLALFMAIAKNTFTPLYLGFAVLAVLEGFWLYFRLRR